MSAPPGPTPHESAAASTGLSVKEAALVVGIVLIWASLYPVGKLTFAEITPSQLTFVRAALASVVLLAVCSVTGRLPLVLDALRPRTSPGCWSWASAGSR